MSTRHSSYLFVCLSVCFLHSKCVSVVCVNYSEQFGVCLSVCLSVCVCLSLCLLHTCLVYSMYIIAGALFELVLQFSFYDRGNFSLKLLSSVNCLLNLHTCPFSCTNVYALLMQVHLSIRVCVLCMHSLCVCLSVCLSICLSVCLLCMCNSCMSVLTCTFRQSSYCLRHMMTCHLSQNLLGHMSC